jgi:hypothetical protein
MMIDNHNRRRREHVSMLIVDPPDARESRRIDHNHQIDLGKLHAVLIHLDMFGAGQPASVPWQWRRCQRQ